MSRAPSSDTGNVELALSLPGGLRVTISGPPSSIGLATQLFNHVAAFTPVGSEPSEFEVVSSVADSPVAPSAQLRGLETRDQVRRSLRPCPPDLFALGVRLCGSSLSSKERICRAWTCGQWASAVRDSRIGSPDRTAPIDLNIRFYAVLQAPGLEKPTIFRSSAGYWNCIGSLTNSDSISQSFPSELWRQRFTCSRQVRQTLPLPSSRNNGYFWKRDVARLDHSGSGCRSVCHGVASGTSRRRWRARSSSFDCVPPAGWIYGRNPVGFLPEEVLANGNADPPPGVVGPSTVFQLPGVVIENGALEPIGSLLSVVVVDLSEEVVPHLRLVEPDENYPFTYDADQPFAVPHPQALITSAREWVEAGGESQRGYFTADGDLANGLGLEAESQLAARQKQRLVQSGIQVEEENPQ
eukprot:s3398_g8.t1